ncbi:MAG: copper chaperone PCu(A)C [Oligoflexia bacterium]|nr:copper chaperone PCu(A)C [Oligoflexia bacterium]
MKKILLFLIFVNGNIFGGSLKIENERVRMLPPSSVATGAFMKISNSSDKEIKLIKAKSSKAKMTELHNHFKIDGMMKMRQVPFIKIPAKGYVLLKPGSFHIMLIDLNGSLKLREKVKIDLTFDNGETITIEPEVKKIRGHQMKKKMRH